jgi:hypothetical protein
VVVHELLLTGDHVHKDTVVQAVVTGPANSNRTSVTLYVLFEPVRFFELAVFSSLHGCVHHALAYNTGCMVGVLWGLGGSLLVQLCIQGAQCAFTWFPGSV